MLAYTTILLVCLLLAAVSVFIYRMVSNSSRSVYSSKQPIGTILRSPDHSKDDVASHAVAGAAHHTGRTDKLMSWRSAKLQPAMPSEQFYDNPQSHGVQLSAQPHGHGTGVGKVSGCSLYDVDTAKAEIENNRVAAEERVGSGAMPANAKGCSLYHTG